MSTEPLPVTLRIGISGDFADVFEVKEGRVHADPGRVEGMTIAVDDDAILLSREVGAARARRQDHRASAGRTPSSRSRPAS